MIIEFLNIFNIITHWFSIPVILKPNHLRTQWIKPSVDFLLIKEIFQCERNVQFAGLSRVQKSYSCQWCSRVENINKMFKTFIFFSGYPGRSYTRCISNLKILRQTFPMLTQCKCSRAWQTDSPWTCRDLLLNS